MSDPFQIALMAPVSPQLTGTAGTRCRPSGHAGRMARSRSSRVGGHRLALTNLDKVMYPETGTTKAEVIAYYAAIAPVLLPHCHATGPRPASAG